MSCKVHLSGKLIDNKLKQKNDIFKDIDLKHSSLHKAENKQFSLKQKMQKVKRDIEHVKIDVMFDEKKLRKIMKKISSKRETLRRRQDELEKLKEEFEKQKNVNVQVIFPINLDKN